MFVVTPDGVIATDPIAYQRPQAALTYIEEIRKVTQAPITSRMPQRTSRRRDSASTTTQCAR